MAEKRRWDPYWLAGYTWSTWLAPAYQPSSGAEPLADPLAGCEPDRDDEWDDAEEIEIEAIREVP